LLSGLRWRLFRRKILDQNRDVLDAAAASGSESSESSTTLMKCSRFILHPSKKAPSHRVAAIFVAFIIPFFAVAFVFLFLFVFFLVRFLSKADIARGQGIMRVCVEIFWRYCAHAQWYAPRRFA
jgi:hypothetical protein